MDHGDSGADEVAFASAGQSGNQSLELSLQLALKERDSRMRDSMQLAKEKEELLEKMEQLRVERDRALESLNGEMAERSRKESQESNGASDQLDLPEKLGLIESEVIDTGTDKVVWETHRVTLERVPGFGFGIAVSGGKDNPHFSNGDPSIAISDVLKAGPAENKLQINDRVLSVNGTSLEEVEHSGAIRLLKESGHQVELVVKRKLLVSNPADFQPTNVLLQKRNKRDDYGVILGCKFYVKEVVPNSLAALDGAIKEGDTILKVNNISVESISLQDARRQLEKSKEKLQLTLKKPPRAPSVTNLLHKRQNSDLDYMTKFQPFKTDNMYLSSAQHDKGDYDKPSINSFVRSTELSTQRQTEQNGTYRRPDQAVIQLPIVTNGYNSDVPPQSASSLYYESSPFFGCQPAENSPDFIPIRTETRYISYNKEGGGGAGLRIAGGNHTGIYVAGVQEGSPAQREGVRMGDEIIKIDGQPTRGMTREEAVMKIMGLDERIELVVQNRMAEFRRVLASVRADSGDMFHIRTHMTYEAPKGSNHMSFQPGDIFKVVDTLRSGVVGEWVVVKLDAQNEELARGVIPSKARAECLRRPKEEREKAGRGSIFRRKNQKRSKSLGRDHWEDVIFAKEATKYEAYERVVLLEPGFMRPVVIYGGMSDIAQEKLIKEVPDLFEAPPSTTDGQDDEVSKTGIVKLGSIRSVIDLGKHCVLDVIPSAIDKLNYAQYYPIVVNLRADRKEIIKELRSKYPTAKSSRKLYEQSVKVEKTYPQIFTKEIELHPHIDWFTLLREVIAKEQVKALWISEHKPTENMADDFLFPMANRLSYIASPENEMDTSRPSEQLYASNTLERNMARASSDPNMASPEDEMPAAPNFSTQLSTFGVGGEGEGAPPPPYKSRSHYAASGHRMPRDRMLSDSRVHYHSSPLNGYDSLDRRGSPGSNGKSGHQPHVDHRVGEDNSSSSGHRHSHYMSPRSGKSPHDPYKFTRMSSTPTYSKPAPPVRSDSMGSSGKHTESPYAHPRVSSQKRINHSMSLDAGAALSVDGGEQKMRNYESPATRPPYEGANPYTAVGRVRRPSGPTANSHYHLPQSPSATASNNFIYSAPTGRRTNGQYAAPHLMSQSLPSDDNVFHATPVSLPRNPSSFSNQVYMDSKEASSVVGSAQQTNQDSSKTSSSFDNYKKIVSNTPFYGAKRDSPRENPRSRNMSGHNSGQDAGSAFESYKRDANLSSSRLDMEPTPENHILLDTVSGVFDSSGGVLSSESTGVSLYLPPNAIPNGISHEIYFKVCTQDNSLNSALDTEKGEKLLSPLVLCGPQGLKFQLPVELRLPHAATENTDRWNFALKSSDTTGGSDKENRWQTQNLDNIPPSPNPNTQNSVAILVDHF